MIYLIRFFFTYLNGYIPKKDEIIFHSFPDYTDNAYAVFKYLIKINCPQKITWLVIDTTKYPLIKEFIAEEFPNKNIKVLKKKSLKGLWSFLRTKNIFFTHGIYGNLGNLKKQNLINLWHGMPLKKMGFYLDVDKSKVAKTSYSLATSQMFREIISCSFDIPHGNIFISGSPRNDLIYHNNKNPLKKLKINTSYSRLILWMPTYIEGEPFLPLLTAKKLHELNEFLKQIKVLLIIKPHPFHNIEREKFSLLDNILFIDDKLLFNLNIQLYTLLGFMDALITDYSSIYFDFLLLDRPIGFIHTSPEKYINNRGIILSPLDYWTPGMKINHFNELMKFIEKVSQGIDEFSQRRKLINKKVNSYNDNKNSKRFLEELNLK
ncbi:CDP-glycerol glycerophosphotransferase, TagB/SpsB family [Bacillus sp. OV194]|nr:CDP-glycerol glycerophosphotransferase, TagB/SpsB family [Bacillus sp. OV194]